MCMVYIYKPVRRQFSYLPHTRVSAPLYYRVRKYLSAWVDSSQSVFCENSAALGLNRLLTVYCWVLWFPVKFVFVSL
jgi:hypothetical protein